MRIARRRRLCALGVPIGGHPFLATSNERVQWTKVLIGGTTGHGAGNWPPHFCVRLSLVHVEYAVVVVDLHVCSQPARAHTLTA